MPRRKMSKRNIRIEIIRKQLPLRTGKSKKIKNQKLW